MIIEADEQGNWKISMAEYIEREKIWPALNAACVPYNRATQKAIESIPAADVRPLVRGIWEKQDANFVCNNVGLYSAAYKCNRCGKLNIAETNYCPNCGAKMEES